jgi:triosephosphate isomerase
MLADLACKYTIVGHSERRSYHAESDALVAEKARRLLEQGIIPILCVGEPLEVREAENHVEYTLKQLEGSLEGVNPPSPAHLVIAYEPVWAIGTGKTATPEDAEAMHRAIRGWLMARYGSSFAEELRILYGGSVKPDNAAALFAQPNIDGGLVGGASLKLDDYLQLLTA